MKKKIIVSVIIGILGILSFTGFLVYSIMGMADGLLFEAPSQMTHNFEEGTYTIFHEFKNINSGSVTISSYEDLNGLNIVIRDQGGKTIPISPAVGSTTYNINNRSGRGIFTFDIPLSGEYHISTESNKNVVLNISQMTAGGIIKMVFTALGIMFSTGILILIVLLKKAKPKDEDYDRYED
ncbi:hypothetical protein EZV73_10410 [Acidaminobacter sp. JC074]|uniref:hypothetical protein n=1 Tax=Acidaminobacter sp. JC074 TaxID=2530199 RepID=UPI001F10C66E|nr:hypothetical protein [Acidaminobacter sp. JC074]MCH4887988.1 hypothetical protein [Acidaminobacter sp. JC074]